MVNTWLIYGLPECNPQRWVPFIQWWIPFIPMAAWGGSHQHGDLGPTGAAAENASGKFRPLRIFLGIYRGFTGFMGVFHGFETRVKPILMGVSWWWMMVNSDESWNLEVSIVIGLPNEWFFRENLFRNGWWLGVAKNFRKPPYDTLLGGLIWWLIGC